MAGEVARTWFMTIWPQALENMGLCSDIEHDPEQVKKELQDYFDDIGGQHYTAICKSSEGKYHIHDVVTFDSAKRLKAVAGLYGKSHCEVLRGTKDDAKSYIDKSGKFEEKGEEIILKWGNPDAIANNRGNRTDLKQFDELIARDDFNLLEFLQTLDKDYDIKYYTGRFSRARALEAQDFRRVEVYYIEGEAGSGKTRGAVELASKWGTYFKCSVDEKSSFPFDGYCCEKTIILDELRPGVFSHAYLMQLLDGYRLNVNVKGGNMPACWTKIIISTALPLSEWYRECYGGKIFIDIENKKKQFLRRIKYHYIAKDCKLYDFDSGEPITL